MHAELPRGIVCLDSFFFPKLQDTPEESLDWLRNLLNCYDLLFPHKCLLEELWIPINLVNQHWILVTVDFVHGTYFAINPIHPNNPTVQEISIADFIADSIWQEFGFESNRFVLRSPNHIHRLPVQFDGIYCEVYMCMYMVIYAFGSFLNPYIGDLLPKSIDECRFLMLCWLLKGKIFFLPNN